MAGELQLHTSPRYTGNTVTAAVLHNGRPVAINLPMTEIVSLADPTVDANGDPILDAAGNQVTAADVELYSKGVWIGDFPTDLPAGEYAVRFISDGLIIAHSLFLWSGTQELTLATAGIHGVIESDLSLAQAATVILAAVAGVGGGNGGNFEYLKYKSSDPRLKVKTTGDGVREGVDIYVD